LAPDDLVLIGGPEPGPLVIADYDPSWPVVFEEHAGRIRGALGERALRVEHIGSTAVPGLAAKPIVDVLVIVADPEGDLAALERAGYELRVVEPGHRMFRTPARDVHVHVWADEGDHVRFRDLLRRDPAARREYEELKRSLAGRDWPSMDDYAQAKGPLIRELLRRAGP
jgi:GrpB-like predicted nucleotidyltransferase (UPF0157 family)